MDEKLLKELEHEASKQGVNRVSLVNEILREALKNAGKLSLIAFVSLHCMRTPLDWSMKALSKSASAGVAMLKAM